MSEEQTSYRFMPNSLKRRIFSLKWVPLCNFKCESQDFEAFQAEKLAQQEEIYKISHAIGKNRSSMANRKNPKRKLKSVQISEVITKIDISDDDLEEPGYRFLCYFSTKKYLSCIMFLPYGTINVYMTIIIVIFYNSITAIMIAAWSIFLSHLYYEEYVVGEQYRAYVYGHNKVRGVVQKAFSVTNMLRMRHDLDLEDEVENELTCDLNETENQAINLLRSETFIKWSEVLDIWSDSNNLNISSFRKLVWATNSRVGCSFRHCKFGDSAIFLYMCKYFYIPYKHLHDREPFEKGNFNAKCRDNFDSETKLCLNSCPYHDSSDFCVILPKRLCDHESGLPKKQCQGTCFCPKNTIYFYGNETDDYVKAFNDIRNFFKNNQSEYEDLNDLIKDSELENSSIEITTKCTGTYNDWYFTSKYLTRFLDQMDSWKDELMTKLSTDYEGLTDFYKSILSNEYNRIGCSLGICSNSFYYHCVFE